MAYGHVRSRDVPSARPNRLLAPSATTRYRARISVVEPSALADDDTADEAALDDRRDGLVAVEEGGPGRDRRLGDELVEPVAPGDEAVRREHRMRRPADLDVVAAPGQPDPVDALEPGQRVGVDAHLGELVDGARRERVAARLHARQRPPFEDRDAVAGRGEPDRGRRTGGAGTDDDRVDGVTGGVRRRPARRRCRRRRIGCGHPAPAGEPGAGSVPIGMMSSTDSSKRRQREVARFETGEDLGVLRAPLLELRRRTSAVSSAPPSV